MWRPMKCMNTLLEYKTPQDCASLIAFMAQSFITALRKTALEICFKTAFINIIPSHVWLENESDGRTFECKCDC